MIQAPRGTRDIFSPEIHIWQHIENVFRNISDIFGYTEMRTPIFESVSLFSRSVGDSSDIVTKEMYVFKDKKGRDFALRPENTASIVRAYIQDNIAANNDITITGNVSRLSYIGPMFRYERPQAGRSRQFHQLGLELFGISGPEADFEVINFVKELLNRIGIDYQLDIGSVGCSECRPAFRQALIDYCRKDEEKLCPQCRERLKINPLRILDCKVSECKEYLKSAPSPLDFLCQTCKGHLDYIKRNCDKYSIKNNINDKLVRGLDYYTRTVFEFKSSKLGAQDAVAAGGRYDNLINEFGGKDVPAVGFAAGIERLVLSSEIDRVQKEKIYFFHIDKDSFDYISDIIINFRKEILHNSDNMMIYQELRRQDLKISKVLSSLSKSGFDYAVFAGEQEKDNNTVVIKDIKKGEQITVGRDEFVGKMIRILKD